MNAVDELAYEFYLVQNPKHNFTWDKVVKDYPTIVESLREQAKWTLENFERKEP